MKIWVINPFDRLPAEEGTAGRYTLLVQALANLGHEVIWWSSSFSHSRKIVRSLSDTVITESFSLIGSVDIKLINARPYTKNVSLARICSHRDYCLNLRKILIEELNVAPPDLVICSIPPPGALSAILSLSKTLSKHNILVDVQDVWPDSFRVLLPSGKLWDIVARIIFANSRREISKLFSSGIKVTATCRTYLEWAFDKGAKGTGYFYLATRQRALKTSSVESKGKPVRFIYAGSMGAVYDLTTILEAARLLKLRNTSFSITFVGTGEQEAKLRRRSRALGLVDIVEFRGFLQDHYLTNALLEADVGIIGMHPQSAVVMPNKVGDYLSAGLALLNSLPGELQELIDFTNCGKAYSAGKAESLATAMENYIHNRDVLIKHRVAARALFNSKFDSAKVYPEFAERITSISDSAG